MKVVLVRLPFYALFGVTAPKMKTYPLNLLYLATYLKQWSTHEAVLVDGENISCPGMGDFLVGAEDPEIMMNHGIPQMLGILREPHHPFWSALESKILDEQPDLIGITCNSGNMDTARVVVGRLRAHGIPIVLGGSHPTVLPEQSLRYTGADLCVQGEGEQTLLDIVQALSSQESMAAIPSVAQRSGDSIQVNARGPLIKDIDDLPIPDRTLIRRSDYYGEVIMTGRGCPFDCSYCASRTIWGKTVRLRSVSSMLQELRQLRDSVGSEGEERPGQWVVKILDDTFTVNRRRTLELLDAIIEEKLNCFEFTGGLRADTLDETVVEKMREANFRRVTLGVESGSPRILKMIRKGESNDDVKRALVLLREANIKSHAFFMIGLPGETSDDIELSKQFILESQPDYVEVNMVTPYPGTELFEKLMPGDPNDIDRWHRWFHQGMATHSERLGYDLDRAYQEFQDFVRSYVRSRGGATNLMSAPEARENTPR